MSLSVFDPISLTASRGKHLGGVQDMTMPKHLIVEVRASRSAGASYVGDMLAALNALAFSDKALTDVCVARHEALCVGDLDNMAVGVFPT